MNNQTPDERAEALIRSLNAWYNMSLYPSMEDLLADKQKDIQKIAQALRDERRRVWQEAAKMVCAYNCDHDHGKKATKACDDLEDLFIAQAIREQARREG